MSRRSNDARYDVCLILATTAPPNPALDRAKPLQHVSLQYEDPLDYAYPPSNLALLPGEYLTNMSGQRDGRYIYSLTFETSLQRSLIVGDIAWRGETIWFTAPSGHELRSIDVMTDWSGAAISVRPHFAPRSLVATHYAAVWRKMLDKIQRKADKRDELKRDDVNTVLTRLDGVMTRLRFLDDRQTISPSALAATFDSMLTHALVEVFSCSNILAVALTLRNGATQRIANLGKLSERLQKLSEVLADRFEGTELRFLTVASASDGADTVPFLLCFVRQPITPHNCDAAIDVIRCNVRTMANYRLDYVSRLMHYFVCTGDLARLETVVEVEAAYRTQTKAQVFKAWEEFVPAIRLAIKHRHAHVLKWLLFEVRLFPEDRVPVVQLDDHSEDRLWTIDELLTKRTHEAGPDRDELACCHQYVMRVRRARAFQEQAHALVNRGDGGDPEIASKVEQLVPLITHAFDLKWLFTCVDLYNIPCMQAQRLFMRAFKRVLAEDLVLDPSSAIFFNRAFKDAKRQGYISRDRAYAIEVDFQRAHVKGSDWVRELQRQVRQTVHAMDSAQARIDTLQHSLEHLRQSIAHREQTNQERQCRKQLLSTVASLLPMVSPAFSILDQCISLCNPFAIVSMITDTSHITNDVDLDRFLRGDNYSGGLRLQPGLAEELRDVHINADDLMDVLRDAIRKDSQSDDDAPQCDDGEKKPRSDSATQRLRFRDVVTLYMEQRRELDEVMQTSFRMQQASDSVLVDNKPTWKWYNMLTSVRSFFSRP